MQHPFVRFDHVEKSYDGKQLVVRDLTLDIAQGEFLTLLGPSGSGKTTTLMMLAGFETATSGEIYLDGKPINRIAPEHRNIGMVFQSYALFPHMTVAENVGFPLSVRGITGEAAHSRVMAALDKVGLKGLESRRPARLQAFEAHLVQRRHHTAVRRLARDAAHAQGEAHVFCHRHVWKQCVALEHHADVAVLGRNPVDRLAVQVDLARGGGFKAGQHHQRGGFARARGSEQREEFALCNVQRQIAHHQLFAVIAFFYMVESDKGMLHKGAYSRGSGQALEISKDWA